MTSVGDSLVGADTGGLEGLRAELLILVGDEVHAEGEVVNLRTLAAEIEDPDLGVGDTTVEPGFGVRLKETMMVSKPNDEGSRVPRLLMQFSIDKAAA